MDQLSANGGRMETTRSEDGPIYNGMPARQLGTEGWLKPWSGGNGGNCVEAMKLADGRVAMRQSNDPDGPALIYTLGEIHAFIEGAKAGQADFLLS